MIYSNPEFFILYAVTFTAYLLSSSYRARFLTLLFASAFFYAWSGWVDSLIFAAGIAGSGSSTLLAHHYPSRKKAFFTGGVVVMALHLFFWKYAPWLCGETQKLWPPFLDGASLNLPLPVGISFFTLQGIAYLVDYERGQAKYMAFPKYVLFKSFFAQLVSGPIVRVHELLPQLERLPRPRVADVTEGLGLFARGLFKKLILADRTAIYVDMAFKYPSRYDRVSLLMGVLGFTVQIWADFSGYTDMGRGVARMLGIHLPENFKAPYFAKKPSEFWQRWHITLSQWIRDYIYIPLGGSRGNPLRVLGVVTLTMVISGLWHGANWTFLLWGFYHGVLLGMERLASAHQGCGRVWARVPTPLREVLLTVTMFCATAGGWLLFRANGLHGLSAYARHLLSPGGSDGLPSSMIFLGFALCLALQALEYYNLVPMLRRQITARLCLSSHAFEFIVGSGAALLVIASLFFRTSSMSGSFIYFQF